MSRLLWPFRLLFFTFSAAWVGLTHIAFICTIAFRGRASGRISGVLGAYMLLTPKSNPELILIFLVRFCFVISLLVLNPVCSWHQLLERTGAWLGGDIGISDRTN